MKRLATALRTAFMLGVLIAITGLHNTKKNDPDSKSGNHNPPGLPMGDALKHQVETAEGPTARADPGGSTTSKSDGPGKTEDQNRDNSKSEPDFSNPTFDDRKLTEYALNPDHKVGKHKAKVIESATGFGKDDAATVKDQILDQVKDADPMPGKVDEHGSRYSVDVELAGPNGKITVRTAWIVDAETGETRLVTVSFP
jgi:hypothetical protein